MKYEMKTIALFATLFIFISFISGSSAFANDNTAPFKYPETKKVIQADDYHGFKVDDPYRWLEDANSGETAEWVSAQQKFSEQYLGGIGFRSPIKNRLTELWNYEKYQSIEKRGNDYFFLKNDGLREQSILYIRKGLKGTPDVLLDPNTLWPDNASSLTQYYVSKDAKYVAYEVSPGGSDWREYNVIDVKTRKKLDDHVEWAKFSDLNWYKNGFFYCRYDKPQEGEQLKAKLQGHKLYYHKINTPQSADPFIYTDPTNPQILLNTDVSSNETFLIIRGREGSADYEYVSFKNLKTDSAVTPLIKRGMGRFNFVDEINGKFFFVTDCDAPNFKLIRIDPAKPQKENWEVIIPESTDKLNEASFVGGKFIVSYLKDANSAVSVFDVNGHKLHDIRLPGIGRTTGFYGKSQDNEVFYSFSSFTTPSTYYIYKVKENKSDLFQKPTVKFDPNRFEIKQIFYESKDKTRVPLFIVYKKGIKLDGQNPTLLYAYGGFNISLQPEFRAHLIPFLEAGGVYARACLRGGGEYGEKWHKAGMLDKKQNVFDDYIAAAEYLIQAGYTSSAKLAAWGGSNGGLLVGAVINQRPDLFKVAIPEVGVMDMLRFQKFTIGWAWVGEYGSSDNPDQFKYLVAYSPLHNIKEGVNYPAVLVRTADHDDRVFPAHSFKYAATLQEKYKGENPVLLNVETKAGHGTGGGTSKQIDTYADMYAFVFYNMKVTPVF